MSPEALFLTSFAKAMAAMSLYKEGHPARERALDNAYARLADVQGERAERHFTFLGSEVLVDGQPLRELREWDWSLRLGAVGIQRIELVGPVSRDDLGAFLVEAFERLAGEPVSSAEVRQGRPTNIRYGEVALQGEEGGSGTGADDIVTATLDYSLREEIEGVMWLQKELKDQRQLRLLEAEAIVRSLSVAMHGDQAFLIPLLRLKNYDQYTVTHTMNVSVLTMALAEFVGLSPKEVRTFGIAGLLHDVGKVRIPEEILNKPGALTDEERLVMNSHTTEGARMILEAEEHLDMAAVVAYEHHIRIDGGGYPALQYGRVCHQASNLVHVCDVFDALRTKRPYRDAWPAERALDLIEQGAGPEFDAEIARAFVRMMRQQERRVARIDMDEPEVHFGREPGGEREEVAAASASPPGDREGIDLGVDVELGDDLEEMEWEDGE